ncbi:hypothetical protein V1279_004563 [Bradyrhizobium sp. AZCC 1610]|uniref:O-antigen ligase family protein n=1 Tax=Bradyrhizobium sp. AZCC 1610 TaxID=3117020 RepID=UPI002FF37A73
MSDPDVGTNKQLAQMDNLVAGTRSRPFIALDFHFVLAIIVSSGSIIVTASGGPLVTASILVGSILAAAALNRYRDFRIIDVDLLFATFCLAIVVSFALNGYGDLKEAGLLFLSLLAYLVGRFAPTGMRRTSFTLLTAVIVFIGAGATFISLATQTAALFKPIVFGSDHSAIVFLSSLSFLIIALASTEMSHRQGIVIAMFLALPLGIFAAAQVRFTFVALAATMVSMLLLSRRGQRQFSFAICFVIALAAGIGLASRFQTTSTYLKMVLEPSSMMTREDSLQGALPATACLGGASAGNSFVVRKVLLRDALKAIPSSGFFGTGLASFPSMTCVPNSEPHNSFLQATIEFGWLGGLALLGLTFLALRQLVPLVRIDSEARFVFGSLVFVVVLDLAHGILSRDTLLFLFAGYAARLVSTRQTGQITRSRNLSA